MLSDEEAWKRVNQTNQYEISDEEALRRLEKMLDKQEGKVPAVKLEQLKSKFERKRK